MDECVSDRELHEELQDMERLSGDLKKLLDNVENMSVQLTWMVYDMVVLRTSPEVTQCLKKLEAEITRCKAVLNSESLETVDQRTEIQPHHLLETESSQP